MVGHIGIVDADIASRLQNLREPGAGVRYPGTGDVSRNHHSFGISKRTSGGVSIDNEKVGISWDGPLRGELAGSGECQTSSDWRGLGLNRGVMGL